MERLTVAGAIKESISEKDFFKAIKWKTVEEKITTLSPGSQWSFFTARASSHAGVVGRVVGLAKEALDRSLGPKHQRRHRKFTTKEMRILLYEAASMINNRPLSVVYTIVVRRD